MSDEVTSPGILEFCPQRVESEFNSRLAVYYMQVPQLFAVTAAQKYLTYNICLIAVYKTFYGMYIQHRTLLNWRL